MKAKTSKKLNAEWHRIHPMPKNPTREQRLAWHREHALHCRCRSAPIDILAELKSRQDGTGYP